jgi:15-cis-phytoene synthase
MLPPSPDPGHTRRGDLAACREILRQGSRTFFAASLLLPAPVRDPATALYAFCRFADDVVDLQGGGMAAVERLRARLDRAYAGRPKDSPVDRAFADVVAHHAIPRALPEALLEGMAWDAQGRRYDQLADLRAYAVRVAGTVGAMMALLMGARAPELTARACDLGVAMQLTNIARDVGEDARAGRLYLPLCWLEEARIDPDAWLARPEPSAAIGRVVQRLLLAADPLYRCAGAGIARLPRRCQPGIRAAAALYAEIGREVERRGLDPVTQRAVVAWPRKLALLSRALGPMSPPDHGKAPALAEARFLIDAIAPGPTLSVQPGAPAPWDVGARIVWVIALFERLERRAHLERLRVECSE